MNFILKRINGEIQCRLKLSLGKHILDSHGSFPIPYMAKGNTTMEVSEGSNEPTDEGMCANGHCDCRDSREQTGHT